MVFGIKGDGAADAAGHFIDGFAGAIFTCGSLAFGGDGACCLGLVAWFGGGIACGVYQTADPAEEAAADVSAGLGCRGGGADGPCPDTASDDGAGLEHGWGVLLNFAEGPSGDDNDPDIDGDDEARADDDDHYQ